MFTIGRPHNDIHINASNVSSFKSNSAITLHPNMFGKSTFTYCCVCQAEVAVIAESKLQELLEFGSVYYSAKIGVMLCYYLQIATIVFCDM